VHNFIRSAVDDRDMHVAGEPEWFDRGLDLFGRRPDKDWSLTDCISFAIMSERGLTHALTADRHFAQAGFVPMLAS
jgi:predicted nucleic acid-binding protein